MAGILIEASDKLIFVYNADSGFANAMVDVAHKFFSPGTYACNLCQLTHSAFGMRERWANFLSSLGREMEFLHKDEFRLKHPGESVALPAVLNAVENEIEVLLSADELNEMLTLEQLMASMKDRLGP